MERMRVIFCWAILVPFLTVSCLPQPHRSRIDPALATLIPAEAVALAGVRIDRLRESPLYDDFAPFIDQAFDGASARNAAVRLWELLIVYTPEGTIRMARGRFSASGIEPRLSWPGAHRSKYRNYLFITDGRRAVSFMNASTALAGPPERLKTVIDQRDSGRRPPADLLAIAEAVDASNQIWAVARGGVPPPTDAPEALRRALEGILPKLLNLRAAARVEQTMRLEIRAECRNPEDAETLRSAANVLIGFTRRNGSHSPALREALGLLSVQREGTAVTAAAELPARLVKELLATGPPS